MLYVVSNGLTTFSGSCRNGLTGDTSLATLLPVLFGYEWWCKQYKVGTGLTLFQEYIE